MQNDKMNSEDVSSNLKGKKKSSLKNKAGEFIEKVGHKISDAGAPTIGQKIHDLGDKLEDEHDNPSHPHKV